MFDLSDRPSVFIPVKWSVLRPNEDPEKNAVEQEVEIDVEVEILDRDELVELFNLRAEGGDGEAGDDKRARELKAFMRVVSDIRKLKDGGKTVKFDEAVARKLLALPGFLTAFEAAYFNACAGKLEIRRKN